MGNCLITQLKGSVSNENLQPYGTIKIGCIKTGSPSKNAQEMGIFAIGQTITVNGNGYFALTYEGLDDPSSRLTSYTIPSVQASPLLLYFKNDNYDIFITGRYDTSNIRYLRITKETSEQTIFSLDVDELKYVTGLQNLKASNQNKVSGNLSSLAKTTIQEITINNSSCTGRLMDLGVCTSLTILLLNRLDEKDDIVDFVLAQIENGRATCTSLSIYRPSYFSTFGGNNMEGISSFATLSWTSSSHIVLEGTDTVYIKGTPTAEEEAAWAEKTVIEV